MVSNAVAPTRLILFEVAGAVYALPIEDVLEVLENRNCVGIPTLPPEVGGVVNHHGEALPVITPSALFAPAWLSVRGRGVRRRRRWPAGRAR